MVEIEGHLRALDRLRLVAHGCGGIYLAAALSIMVRGLIDESFDRFVDDWLAACMVLYFASAAVNILLTFCVAADGFAVIDQGDGNDSARPGNCSASRSCC